MLSGTGPASGAVRMRLGVVHHGPPLAARVRPVVRLHRPATRGGRYRLGSAIGRLISVQFTQPLGIPLPL